MPSFAWSCKEARDATLFLSRELTRRGLTRTWFSDDTVDTALVSCAHCRSDRPNPRRCTGWTFGFRGAEAILLQNLDVHGRSVAVRLEGVLDFRRPAPKAFENWPVERASLSISVSLEGEDELLSRTHCDLAERAQYGHVWHLQSGGLASMHGRPSYEWLDVPRWPAMPMDALMLADLVLFNFTWEVWREVNASSPWRLWLRRSEDLMLTSWVGMVNGRWNQPERGSLATHQCNLTGTWDPRPAS